MTRGNPVHSAHELSDELRPKARALRNEIGDVFSGYAEMSRAAMSEGALSARTKELIALAIAATRECDGCIGAHARGAQRAGASAAEVAEAMGVVIMMNGGPGTVWGPRAFAAYEEWAADRAPEAPVV
ncbi:MAG: carboxymuconolactone decarboxylase family protein [Acidimicrobiales bacterium]|jgi:AhpD family alkylhydroperoxidase